MITLASPAKLNLFFRVLRKRPDGYHDIASLFQTIDLCDHLTVQKAASDQLSCTDPQLPVDGANLVWQALQLFRSHYPLPSVHIHLEKKIPIQAGLGGGSGNAATTLWALNQLAGLPASLFQLQQMGAQLGSDVPFFFSLGTAYCTGRGEVLEPFLVPHSSGYLAKPPFGLSTPAVYRETRLSELPPFDPRKALASFLTAKPHFCNDLEPAAMRLEPRLLSLKQKLLAGGFQHVSMTGSGTAFFCFGEGKVPGVALTPFRFLNRKPASWYG